MTLIVLTVVVIALLIAVLAIFLFRIGMLLNRTADDLDDCAQNVKNISYQAEAIGPGVVRINETGTVVLGALPLLCDGAESVAVAKGAPYVDPSEAPSPEAPEAPSSTAAPVPSAAAPRGVGYLDGERGTLGYLDAS
jgi:hypothetical protein